MPMTYNIQEEHYPILNKLAELFFETQTLSVPRHLLLKNTSSLDMRNYLIGFSDGSNQFSTACIYLVSYNIKTNEVHTSLVNPASKIADNKNFAQSQEYVPVKEIHGLLLCTSSITRIVKGFQECNIALNGYNVDIVQVSQIVALRSPPCHSKSRMKEYHANIDIHLYKLAQLTGQLKENIVFWINQRKAFNPADLLGKFDIDKDHVSRWMELARRILQPPWLQRNPDTYFRKMLDDSNDKIRELMTGNHNKQPVDTDQSLVHDCTELKQGGDLMINFINVQDRFTPIQICRLPTTGNNCHQEQVQGLKLLHESNGLRYMDSSPLEGYSLPKKK